MAGQIRRGKAGSVLSWEGRTLTLGEDVYAREGHPILEAYPNEFEPVFVAFEVDGDTGPADPPPAPAEEKTEPEAEQEQTAEPVPEAEAVPGAEAAPGPEAKPEPKAVRRWAAENGIEVPARGKIPDAVYEQYAAAQE